MIKESKCCSRVINVSLNYEISIVFNNVKNYNAHLIIQQLNKLVSINSFYISSFPSDSLVKTLGENNFRHLSLELDSEASDLAKTERILPYECICDFEKF